MIRARRDHTPALYLMLKFSPVVEPLREKVYPVLVTFETCVSHTPSTALVSTGHVPCAQPFESDTAVIWQYAVLSGRLTLAVTVAPARRAQLPSTT